MGQSFTYSCKNCGYKAHLSTGVGFLFFEVPEEVIAEGKAGDLGEEIKAFLQEHPDGTLDTEEIAYRCSSCGSLESGYCLDMYVPKQTEAVNARAPVGRFISRLLEPDYDLYKRFEHRCKRCGTVMDELPEDLSFMQFKCPDCGSELTRDGFILWD